MVLLFVGGSDHTKRQETTTMTMSNSNEPARINPRTAWSTLLALIGLFTLSIGTALLFGGAWTAIIIGSVLLIYSMILALPTRNTYWN